MKKIILSFSMLLFIQSISADEFKPSASCPLPKNLVGKTPESICIERGLLNVKGLPRVSKFEPTRCLSAAREKNDLEAGFLVKYMLNRCNITADSPNGCRKSDCDYLYLRYKQVK